jgi:hypothetical protein
MPVSTCGPLTWIGEPLRSTRPLSRQPGPAAIKLADGRRVRD